MERYMCNLHAPQRARAGLFALHAFNIETAKIRSSTSDSNIARMRLLWWRQTVADALDGKPPDHPVAQGLAHAHTQFGLTPRYLEQLLDAREADLASTQPESWPQVLLYCEHTAGALCLLAHECIVQNGGGESETERKVAEQAALQVGAALGIATLLRGTAVHAAQGCTYIPADIAARHRLSLQEVIRGRPSHKISDAVGEMANEAVAHLLAGRSLQRELSTESCAVLLPATIADLVLRRLQQCGWSPFAPQVTQPLGMRFHLELAWHRFRGSY
jgi:phytoene/squalene synthetase